MLSSVRGMGRRFSTLLPLFAFVVTGVCSPLHGAAAVEIPTANSLPAPTKALTLADCINLAMDHNPDILRARSEIERTTGLIVEARSSALPKVTANGDLEWQDGARLEGLQKEPYYWDVGVRVTQTVYQGSKIYSGIQEAKFNEQAAILTFQSTIDQTILNVREAFNAVLLNRSLITVATENLDLLTEELHDQERRYQAGTVTRYNVLTAEVEVANARPALIHAKNDLRTGLAQLAKLISVTDSGSFDQPSLDIQGELPAGQLNQKYEQALATALAQRSDLKALESRYRASEEDVKVAKSNGSPTLDVFAGYDVISSSLHSFGHELNGGIAGIQGSWNLFDGFATKGKVQQAQAGLQTAMIDIDDARHEIELDVREAYSAAVEAQELIQSQQKNIESAQESLRLARARFDAGAGTQLDTLNSNVALTQARTNELQARYDFNNAAAELERAMGILTTFQGAKEGAVNQVRSSVQ